MSEADSMLVARNYAVNGHSGPEAIIAVSAVFAALSTFAVIGRFAARKIRGINLWFDDWLVAAALLFSYVLIGLTIRLVVQGGAGYPLAQHQGDEIEPYLQTLAVIQFFFSLTLGTSKMSICFLLMRIFPVKRFKVWAYIVLAYQMSWMLAAIFLGAFICRPFSFNWNQNQPGVCGNVDQMYVAVAATDLVGDVLIAILPLPSIWMLNASVLKRLGLTVIFSLGILEIIVGIFRIIVLLRVTRSSDFTLDAVETNYLSVIEPSLGVIVACAATLNPLLRISFRKVTESARGLLSATSSKNHRSGKWEDSANTGVEHAKTEKSQLGDISRALKSIDQQSDGTESGEALTLYNIALQSESLENETLRNKIEA